MSSEVWSRKKQARYRMFHSDCFGTRLGRTDSNLARTGVGRYGAKALGHKIKKKKRVGEASRRMFRGSRNNGAASNG